MIQPFMSSPGPPSMSAVRAISDSVGYRTHTLKSYADNPVWTEDPKRTVFRDCAERTLPFGWPGTIGEKAAAALADVVVVDMFANYASGRSSADDAIKQAARQRARSIRLSVRPRSAKEALDKEPPDDGPPGTS